MMGKENLNLTLPVTAVQRFCMRDGPGVRTTVFLKGCPLSCLWCHNPETRRREAELMVYPARCVGCLSCVPVCPTGARRVDSAGAVTYDRTLCVACGACAEACCAEALLPAAREMTVADLAELVARDAAFYGETGGLTLSGGEPMAHPDGALALLRACREQGMTTAVETCGYFSPALLPPLAEAAHLLLWDVKDTDSARHFAHTGVPCEPILDNLRAADRLGATTRLRCILVAGVNTDEAHYAALADLWESLSHCEGVELLPYHAYGGAKALPLGLPDNGRREWIPTEETVNVAKHFLRERGVRVVEG